jgi:hypothetical protein
VFFGDGSVSGKFKMQVFWDKANWKEQLMVREGYRAGASRDEAVMGHCRVGLPK